MLFDPFGNPLGPQGPTGTATESTFDFNNMSWEHQHMLTTLAALSSKSQLSVPEDHIMPRINQLRQQSFAMGDFEAFKMWSNLANWNEAHGLYPMLEKARAYAVSLPPPTDVEALALQRRQEIEAQETAERLERKARYGGKK